MSSNKTLSQRKPWTPNEDKLLTELKKNKNLDWIEVARRIPGRNPSQCSQRWKRIKGFKLRRTWTSQEDELVIDLVSKHGFNWGLISTYLQNRSTKQIREHYLNQLDPQLNTTPWTIEEDLKIVELYQSIGGKWSTITKALNQRSENSVKNRFYSCLRHKYLNVQNPYYIVPSKLNEEDSIQNQIPQQKIELPNQSSFQQQQQQFIEPQQQIISNCFYQVYIPQPMFVPVYVYPTTQFYHPQ